MYALKPGASFDERYEIVKVLGAGAFGVVYKAVQKQFDRTVAIKVLNLAVTEGTDGSARFEREARAINVLKHKNIIGLYGFGVWNNAPYMVTEFAKGDPLDCVLLREGKLPVERALKIAIQIMEGLNCAHAQGIIHRDLKPPNIMLCHCAEGDELVKIIDFGLAKLLPGSDLPSQKLTETGFALGTCHYMSPEQCTSTAVDARADLYSAGCILYQCLTGNIPFDGEESVHVMYKHLNEFPPPLEQVLGKSAEIAALQTFINNCLAKTPDDRYCSADEALKDLRAIARGAFGSVRALSDPKLQLRPTHQQPRSPFSSPLLTVLCALLLGAAVTASIMHWNSSRGAAGGSATPLKSLIVELKLSGSFGGPEEYSKISNSIERIDEVLKAHAGVNGEPEYHQLCALMSDYFLDQHDNAKAEFYARLGDTPGLRSVDAYEFKCHERLMDLYRDQNRLEELDGHAWQKLMNNTSLRRDEYLQILVSDYWRRHLDRRLMILLKRYLEYPRINEYDKGWTRYVLGNCYLIQNKNKEAREWYDICVKNRSNASMRKRSAARLCLMDGKYADVMGSLSYYSESLLPALDVSAAANLHDAAQVDRAITNLVEHRNTIPELPPGMDEYDAGHCLTALEQNGYGKQAERVQTWMKDAFPAP